MALIKLAQTGRLTFKPDINRLLKALSQKNTWDVRKSAAEALGASGDSRAIDPLVGLLIDPDKDVRAAAAIALHALGWQPRNDEIGAAYRIARREWTECAAIGEPAVGLLLAVFKDGDVDDSRAATRALGEIGNVRAIPPLLDLLRDSKWEYIGSEASAAFAKIGGPSSGGRPAAVSLLIEALRDPSADVRMAAARALGEIGDPKAVEPLFDELKDADMFVCESAAKSLAAIGEPAVLRLIDGLSEGRVPRLAAEALGRLGDPRAVAPLVAALGHADWSVRDSASAALVNFGGAAVEPLLAALRVPEKEARRYAAETLDRLEWKPGRDPDAVWYAVAKRQWTACGELGSVAADPLITLLKDADAEMRVAAATTLRKLADGRSGEALIAALGDSDPAVREAAAKSLAVLRDRRAALPLQACLSDEKWPVREAAARALGHIGGEPVVAPLLLTLQDSVSQVREAAAEALGRLGDARAVDPLIEALRRGDEDIHRAAAEALGRLKDRRAVAALLTVLDWEYYAAREAAVTHQVIQDARSKNVVMDELKEKYILIRTAAATALGRIGDAHAVEGLIPALKVVSDSIRQAAAGALGEIGDARAVAPLIGALRDRNSRVRETAVEALVKLDKASVGLLLDELECDDAGAREIAAEALGKIGDGRAVDPLIIRFQDPDGKVRTAAMAALVRIGSSAAESLIAALKEEEDEVRLPAAEVLGKLDWTPGKDEAAAYYWIVKRQWDRCVEIGAAAVGPLIHALKEPDDQARADAVTALSRIGTPSIEPLIDALRHENEQVCRSAIEALGNIGAPAVPALVAALSDEYFGVCRGAAEALGRIGDARAVDPLIGALGNAGWYFIRAAAAEALGKIGDVQAVEPLIVALRDEYFKVRETATEALIRIGKESVEPLIMALMYKEWRVRKSAAEALGKIGDARAVEPLITTLADEDKDVLKAAAWALVPLSHDIPLEAEVKQKILSVLS